MIDLQEATSAAAQRRLIGTVHEVLVEGPARKRSGWLAGKTPHFRTAVFPSDVARPGDTVLVRVDDATAHTLIGRPATAEVARAAAGATEIRTATPG